MEAIENIRTVQALTLERLFHATFEHHLDIPHRLSLKKAIVQGVTFGFASSIFFFINAAAFKFGVYLIVETNKVPMNILRALYAISFTAGSMTFARLVRVVNIIIIFVFISFQCIFSRIHESETGCWIDFQNVGN